MSAIKPSNFKSQDVFSGLKILVIENNGHANMEEYLKSCLKHLGATGENVVFVNSAEEAEEVLNVDPLNKFNILITSDRISPVSGQDFIKKHDRDFELKILSTGGISGAGPRKFPEANNAYILPKPYDYNDLKAVITTGMRNRGSEVEVMR